MYYVNAFDRELATFTIVVCLYFFFGFATFHQDVCGYISVRITIDPKRERVQVHVTHHFLNFTYICTQYIFGMGKARHFKFLIKSSPTDDLVNWN